MSKSGKHIVLPLGDKHAGLHGFTVAQISDVHIGPTLRHRYVRRLVTLLEEHNPHVLLLTGDVADGFASSLAPTLEPLSTLSPHHGKFFITGNHEHYWDGKAWTVLLAQLGFTPLDHANALIPFGNNTIVISGLPDPVSRHFEDAPKPIAQPAKPTPLPLNAFKIMLAHRPNVEVALHQGYHLQLSGHTHGGQFFPWSLLVRLAERYVEGLYQREHLTLYVSPGTGFWGPLNRFLHPSEITHFTLAYEPDKNKP